MRKIEIDRSSIAFRVARWFITFRNRVLLAYLSYTISLNFLFSVVWMQQYNAQYLSYSGFVLFLVVGIIVSFDERKKSSPNWMVVVYFMMHFSLGFLLSNLICHSFILITIVEEITVLVVHLVLLFIIRSYPPSRK